MFTRYTLRPQTTDAIHVTPENYRRVAEWISATLATRQGVDIVHPGTQGQGVPRLKFIPRDNARRSVGVPIPGYLVRDTTDDGDTEYRGESADMFDAAWKPQR